MVNSSPIRIKPDAKKELVIMKEKLNKRDPFAKDDYSSLILRAVKYWNYGDIDVKTKP